MSSVLTPEETAALREQMQPPPASEAAPAEATDPVAAARQAAALGQAKGRGEGIFAEASERGLAKKLPSLEQRFVRMSEALRGVLGKALRCPVTILSEPPTVLTAQAIAQTVPGWAVTAELQWSPMGRAGFIGLNHPFAYALIELAYGAPPTQLANFTFKESRVRLTEVERQTLMPLLQSLAQSVSQVMPERLVAQSRANLMPYPVQFDPQQAIEGGVAKMFEIKVGQAQAQIFVLLFSHVLEHLDDENPNSSNEAIQHICSHLVQTDVNVMAMLGKTHVPLGTVMGLKGGDMLWLESAQTDYLPVFVEDTIKFYAQPIARNGALGVEIVAKVP